MRVLMVGDSPFLKTGFGRVNHHALEAFLAAGFEVACVTALQTARKPPVADLPAKLYIPADDDPMGLRSVLEAYKEFEPDVVYVTGDPGNVSTFYVCLPRDAKMVAYCPIEGEPILHQAWRTILPKVDFFTCSEYGTRVVKQSLGLDIDYVYHGVDIETFTPLPDEERIAYRKRLGWDGKFVVTCVAQNVRRKQIPRLIEAMAILKYRLKQRNIVLYLHTVPFQNHYMEGWNLPEIATAYNVYDEVIFSPLMSDRWASIPERGDIENPGLRELMSASDVLMIPSQVEGFCLPIVEAFASGLPVMVTKYAAGWEIARLGGGVGVAPHDWEIHKSGTRYANLSPSDIAKDILHLYRNPKQLARMKQQGLDALKNFDWAPYETMVVEKVLNASKSIATEAESDSILPTDQATDSLLAPDDLPEGQGYARPAA